MNYYYADCEMRTVGPMLFSEVQRLKSVWIVRDWTWVIEEDAA